MKLTYTNPNYTCQVVRLSKTTPLQNLDKLVGVSVFEYQAIISKEMKLNELVLVFTAETKLEAAYCSANNLFRDATLNKDTTKTGFIEQNCRVKAIKLKGNISSALVMPLDSLIPLGINPSELKEGDVFDTIDGIKICSKYIIPTPPKEKDLNKQPKKKFESRVNPALFPEHIDTHNYFKNTHKYTDTDFVVITQKLHGTSGRFAHIPVKRKLTTVEKILSFFGVNITKTEYATVAGSRTVIKDREKKTHQHYYKQDIWNEVLEEIKDIIPKDTIIYGEIIGWVGNANIQKNYTYTLPQGKHELYIYRITSINADGIQTDYSWDAVKEFCKQHNLKYCPELFAGLYKDFKDTVNTYMDVNYAQIMKKDRYAFNETPVALDTVSPCDEGICIRKEGIKPFITKAKSPLFYVHETKILDEGVADIESVESNTTE